MSKNLPYILRVMKLAGKTATRRVKRFTSGLFTDDHKPHTRAYGGRKRSTEQTNDGYTGKVYRVETVAPVVEQPEKKKQFGFSRLVNPRRFAAILTAAVAAVMIPVIAVSANGGADYGIPITGLAVGVLNNEQPEEPDTQQQAGVEPDAEQISAETENTAEAMQEQTAQEIPEPTPEPKQYLNVTPDEQHADVAELQQRLMDLNYLEIDEPTELYGHQTQLAVSYFQRKHGLAVDGAAGEATQDLLFSDEAESYSVTAEAEGPDVELIQTQLRALGYDVGVTGYFGTETQKAVEYFQRMNGLDDDGSVGEYTKELMFSSDAEPSLEYWEELEEQQAQESESSSSNGDGGDKKNNDDDDDDDDGGSGGGGGTNHVADPGNAQAFVDAAVAQEGKPYVRGGKGPDSFDCSGLVYYALNASGNSVGYMTSGGWASSSYPTVSSISDLQVGDVICFTGHVGVYMGGGTMCDASSSNGKVVIRGLGNWAHSNFICGKRPL